MAVDARNVYDVGILTAAATPVPGTYPPGSTMAELSPSQRTAGTGRILMAAGALVALEAMWQGSVLRTAIASGLLAVGGGLLFFAKRAD